MLIDQKQGGLKLDSHEITRVMKRVARWAPSLKNRRPNSIVRGSSVFESGRTDSDNSEEDLQDRP